MADYVNNTLVPRALEKHNEKISPEDEDDTPPTSRVDFLRNFGLLQGRPYKTNVNSDGEEVTGTTVQAPEKKDISTATITNWLNLFGYSYDHARKHFYNDTHEHPANDYCG